MTLDYEAKRFAQMGIRSTLTMTPGQASNARVLEAFVNALDPLPAVEEIIETDCDPTGSVNHTRPLPWTLQMVTPPPGNRHSRRKWLALQRRELK